MVRGPHRLGAVIRVGSGRVALGESPYSVGGRPARPLPHFRARQNLSKVAATPAMTIAASHNQPSVTVAVAWSATHTCGASRFLPAALRNTRRTLGRAPGRRQPKRP